MDEQEPRIVIVGAGFAGLEVAKRLGRANRRVTVVDRRNYHLFQPLLYQVATAALTPADIATPVRRLLGRYSSVDVLMDAPAAIDREGRTLTLDASGRALSYDRLIVATGARDSYFGHPEWAEHAPGLKSLEDAVGVRSRVLSAFERAEITEDPAVRERLLTFVIVGGGPTGVEMAGSIAELSRRTLRRDFRHVRPESARVILVEATDRLLAPFDADHARYVAEKLAEKGVEVRLEAPVEAIGPGAITFAGETLAAETVFWAAGVGASPVGELLGVPLTKSGQVAVGSDLTLAGDPNVLVLGDLAEARDANGDKLPGLAQVAKQQGAHVGETLARDPLGAVPAFTYRSRGNTAIVGRNAAIFEAGTFKVKGFGAWLLWVFAHVFLLIGFQNRVMVASQWILRYATSQRRSRLIMHWQPRDNPEETPAEPEGEDRGR